MLPDSFHVLMGPLVLTDGEGWPVILGLPDYYLLSVQQDAPRSAAVGSIQGRKYEPITPAVHSWSTGEQASPPNPPTLQQPRIFIQNRQYLFSRYFKLK